MRDKPEWKSLMQQGAFDDTFMSGDEFVSWLGTEERRHQVLMKEAGFLASR